jgi:hypothetical protein
MRYRAHAARIIAKQQLFEALISPGYYLALTAGLLIGYAVVRSFVAAVDSSGFNAALNPLSDFVNRSLGGAFGATFVEKLFAEGPFLLALAASFLPVFLFLAVTSVFKFGLEKAAGAIELITFGPADGTSYLIASLARDVALTAATLAVLLAHLALTAAIHNLALGPTFFVAGAVVLLVAIAIHSYGLLASVVAASGSSALALFLGILVLFLAVLVGSLAITSDYVRTLSTVVSWGLRWVSPFFYGSLCLQGLFAGSPLAVAGGCALLALLAGAILAASHLVIRVRGVRA